MSQRITGILAPPRGGASLIARAVAATGIHLGEDEEFRQPLPNLNDGGTFEHMLFEEIYERLADQLQHPCFGTEPLPDGWLQEEPARNALHDLLDVLTWAPMPDDWGWKSPQPPLLLPLWEQVAAENGAELRFIIPVRNPLDVARSLKRIARLPEAQGLRLWTCAMLAILERIDAHPHCFCDYDAFLADPKAGARQLLVFLGRSTDPETVARVAASAQPELRHVPPASLTEIEAVAGAEVAGLYRHCQARAAGSQVPLGQLRGMADYRRLATLFQFGRSDVPPRWALSSLYLDLGNGFSQGITDQRLLPGEPDLHFDCEYQLPPGVRRILFSPCQGTIFRCRIDQIGSDGGKSTIINKETSGEVDGWDVFLPEGPLPVYEIGTDLNRTTRLRILGRIELAAPPPPSFREVAP